MRRTRIKICGIRTAQDAMAVVEAGADAIGLVFVNGSPRQVDLRTAEEIIARLPAFVEPIALFVDAPLQDIEHITRKLDIRTVQLHGKETPDQAKALAPLRVIKALRFNEQLFPTDWPAWRRGVTNVVGLLVDSPPPADADVPGGHGRPFDWHAMNKASSASVSATHPMTLPEHLAPVILAGGLTPRNVGQAIRTVEPYAVDVSSGVESSRGVKDPDRIHAFCDAVRLADQACAQEK